MKAINRTLSIAVSVLITSSAQAGDVDNFLAVKGQEFNQTNNAAPVQILTNKPFRAHASVVPTAPGLITNATLRLPNGTIIQMEPLDDDGSFVTETSFTTKAQLDGQITAGNYTISISTLNDGIKAPTLTLPADAYPPTPRILNWSDAQEVDKSHSFLLHWFPFTNGTANDFVVLEIEESNGDSRWSTPFLFQPNALNGTNTSVEIAGDTLDSDHTYEGRLLFVKRTSLNTNIPGALGIAGFYKQTVFPLMTLPEAPSEGRIQFSARSFSANENDANAIVTVVRSGDESNSVSVNIATSPGTAADGADFNGFNTPITFPEGVMSLEVAIPLIDDFQLESNETFNVTLSAPTGGAVLGNRSNAVVNLLDNEKTGAGILQFNPAKVSVTEPTATVKVTIARIGATAGTVTVDFHTVGGAATSDVDFGATNGTVTFGPGITTKTIPIRILNDTLDETNETFSVVLDAPTGGAALGSNTTAQVTITDEDLGGTLAFSAATFGTNEFGSFALITVARVGGSASDVTVNFTTQDGTAVDGLDYYATNGTLTFGSNEMKRSFTVLLTNDLEFETNETVALSLSNPLGDAKLGVLSNATLRILDDESRLSFTNASYTIGEAGLKLNINVVRTGARITPVTVNFSTADVLAVSTNDYRGTNGTLTFPPNVGFKTISIPIVNDTVVESNETFTVTLSNPQGGAQLGDLTNTTATITENDLGGVISFSVTNYPATEAGKFANIIINRANGKASGVTVDFTTTDGSATEGLDYFNATRTVTFNANDLSKTVQVPIINDTLDESNETVRLWLSNPQGGASLGVRSNATITIADDDVAGAIALSSAAYVTNENNAFFLITVTRGATGKASDVKVDFTTQDGVALDGWDYFATNGTLTFGSNEVSKVVTVALTNDTLPEGNETFSFRLLNPTGRATLGAISNATLTIRDDESSVAFTNVAYTVTEAGPGISVNVIRSGALITPVTVDFSTLDVSAVSTNDYRGTNGTLTFPINTAFKTITIPIANDTIVDGNETFNLFLHSPSNGLQLGTLTNTVITITDNDLGGIINFKSATYATNESNNATITLTRTNGAAGGVSVTFTTQDGSANVGADYSDASQTVIFGANQTSTNVIVPIIKDALDETNETVQLFLSNVQGGGSLGVVSNALLTITDDDSGGTFRFGAPSYVTNENAGAFLVNVVRVSGLASNVTVDFFTQDGVATLAGLDYTDTHGTLTFSAGETNKSITVPINNDTLPEGNETLSVILTNATGGANISSNNTGGLTIVDDESSISLTNATYTVGEAGPSVSISAVRSGALGTAVSVQFTTVPGSAVSPDDYRGTNVTLTFPAGVGVKTVVIPIVNDTLDESNETFTAFLSTPLGGVQLGTLTNTTVTITDDDTAGVVQFSAASYSVAEGTANASITVSRTGGLASGVTVQFSTVDGGSATAGSDYSVVITNLTFNAGEISKTVLIPIVADSLAESTETVNLFLNSQGGTTLGAQYTAVLNIQDKPDPNAVPITGPVFMSGTIAGAGFTAITAVGTTNFGGLLQVTGFWTTGSGLSTKTHQLIVDVVPMAVGTLTIDNGGSHGFLAYGIGGTSPGDGRAYSVANGSLSAGSYGTFIFDAIDPVNKMVSGRFNFHARETTGNIAGGFIDIIVKFRCRYDGRSS